MKISAHQQEFRDIVIERLCYPCDWVFYPDNDGVADCLAHGDVFSKKCPKHSQAKEIKAFFNTTLTPFLEEQLGGNYD